MSNLSERIASLPPEKRDLLLKKLRGETLGSSAGPRVVADETSEKESRRAFDPEVDRNFHLEVSQPGILDSLKLRACPRKPVGPGQVQIEVYASSLNFRDVMIGLGMYPTPPGIKPVMGSDCAGRIVEVGEGVDDLAVGDEVLALASDSFAGFINSSAATVVRKPEAMSFEDAAAIPTVFLTVYYALHHLARLQEGERLLVHSAAGGVGLTSVQMAKWKGAEVFATVGNDDKRAYLKTLGVERLMNSRSLDFVEEVLEMTEGEGVDVIVNSLAGEAIPKGFSILRPLGRFIELGKRDIYGDMKLGLLPFHKGLSFFAIELSPLVPKRPKFIKGLFEEMVEHFRQGTFEPLPKKVFPISEVGEAFKYMSTGTHMGKIVTRVRGEKILIEPEEK